MYAVRAAEQPRTEKTGTAQQKETGRRGNDIESRTERGDGQVSKGNGGVSSTAGHACVGAESHKCSGDDGCVFVN